MNIYLLTDGDRRTLRLFESLIIRRVFSFLAMVSGRKACKPHLSALYISVDLGSKPFSSLFPLNEARKTHPDQFAQDNFVACIFKCFHSLSVPRPALKYTLVQTPPHFISVCHTSRTTNSPDTVRLTRTSLYSVLKRVHKKQISQKPYTAWFCLGGWRHFTNL